MTEENYNQCVRDLSQKVYLFILNQIKDSQAAQDIVQDSFLLLWEKRKEIDKGKAQGFVFKVAYHKMIDSIRYNKRFTLPSQTKEPQTQIMYSDAKDVITKVLDTLPEAQRAIILLRDNEGYSYKEIAQMLNLSPEKVQVYLYRARVAIKKVIIRQENII
jgi:RNA polymerase sigma factor, sigma-70 family